MAEALLLWITRSLPDNSRTRRAIERIGHRAVTVPVLRIEATPAPPPAREPTGLVFTSGHAVRNHRREPRWQSLPVFAVGDSTAALARKDGYADVRSAGGDVRDLTRLVLANAGAEDHYVHFAAQRPAGELTKDLQAAGVSCEQVAVYESEAAGPRELRAVIDIMGFIDGIIVHSPRAAERIAEIVRDTGWRGLAFCISPACAAPLRGLPGVGIDEAAAPTEEKLLDAIRRRSFGRHRRLEVQGSARREMAEPPPRRSHLRLVVSNDRPAAYPSLAPPGKDPDDPPPSAA